MRKEVIAHKEAQKDKVVDNALWLKIEGKVRRVELLNKISTYRT